MSRVRRHPRLLSALAFGLLAFTAELVGRSLTHRLDFGRHVEAGSYAQASYYPVLLALVKIGVALLLARVAWRFVRAYERRVVASDQFMALADRVRVLEDVMDQVEDRIERADEVQRFTTSVLAGHVTNNSR